MLPDQKPEVAPRRSGRGLRIATYSVLVLLALLVVAYFSLTSSAFVKAMVLPRVSDSLGADVTVSSASISPFKRVLLKDLKVQAQNKEPVLTAAEVEVRYSLSDILKGNYHISAISIKNPSLNVVQAADDTTNLDPLLEKVSQESDSDQPSDPNEPLNLRLDRLAIDGGTVRYTKLHADGSMDLTEAGSINFLLEDIRNDFTGKATFKGLLSSSMRSTSSDASLQGAFDGQYSLALTKQLGPAGIQGTTRITINQASGSWAEAKGIAAIAQVGIYPTEIKQTSFRITRNDQVLTEARVNGPFSLDRMEGRLSVDVLGIDKNLLNLAGGPMGLDFGKSSISSTNLLILERSGQSLALSGSLQVNPLQVVRTNQATPIMVFSSAYEVTVDLAASNAVLKTFSLNGKSGNKPFLSGSVSKPMPFSWGGSTNDIPDAELLVELTSLQLADWAPFLEGTVKSGLVSGTARVVSMKGGSQLKFDLDSKVQQLIALSETNQFNPIDLSFTAKGENIELERTFLPQFKFAASYGNKPVLSATGSLSHNLKDETADVSATGKLDFPALLQWMPITDTTFNSGSADFDLRLKQVQTNQYLWTTAKVASVTGNFGDYRLKDYGLRADMGLTLTPQLIRATNISGSVSAGTNIGGSFQMAALYNLVSSNAEFSLSFGNFNQHGLAPFLKPFLSGAQDIKTVSLSGVVDGQYEPAGSSSFKVKADVTNLVATTSTGEIKGPLQLGLALDAGVATNRAHIRNASIQLTPTQRAKNQIGLTGQIDMSNTNAMQGFLKLAADSLDLTPYYDLYAGDSSATAPQSPAQPQPPPQSAPETEPEPIHLGMTNFVMETSIGSLLLREVEMSNLVAKVAINGPRVKVTPASLQMNGALLTNYTDLDLSVAGYKYDFRLFADRLPLAPLVNSFFPERAGQLGGTVSANSQIHGSGLTGPNLQKHLGGEFGFSTTNLNLQVVNIRNPLLRAVVNVIAILPEIRKNPNLAVGSLVGSLLGGAGNEAPGWASELEKSPVQVIQANGFIGGGQVTLANSTVESPAFRASAKGTIQLASILTNSAINLPLNVALERSVAERINFVPTGTPTNVAFVQLPNYVTLRGTIGEPKTDINKAAILGTALEQFGSKIPGVDDKTGNLIQGLGGILSGRKPTATNPPPATGTNAAPMRPQSGAGLGDLLGNLLGATNQTNTRMNRPANTNAPPTPNNRQTAPTNPPASPGGLLNQLLNPK